LEETEDDRLALVAAGVTGGWERTEAAPALEAKSAGLLTGYREKDAMLDVTGKGTN